MIKIGKYVRITNSCIHGHIINGRIARIVSYHDGQYTYGVDYVKAYGDFQNIDLFNEDEFEVIREKEAFAYMI